MCEGYSNLNLGEKGWMFSATGVLQHRVEIIRSSSLNICIKLPAKLDYVTLGNVTPIVKLHLCQKTCVSHNISCLILIVSRYAFTIKTESSIQIMQQKSNH